MRPPLLPEPDELELSLCNVPSLAPLVTTTTEVVPETVLVTWTTCPLLVYCEVRVEGAIVVLSDLVDCRSLDEEEDCED